MESGSRITKRQSSSAMKSKLLNLQAKNFHKFKTSKATEFCASRLPDELLLDIFKCLSVKDLLSCASTCKHWERVANDNSIWKRFYLIHVTSKTKKKSTTYICEPSSPLEVSEGYWRLRFFRKCKDLRNKRFQSLDKINSFTGTTNRMEEILGKLGTKFQLCLKTQKGDIFVCRERTRTVIDSTTLVRWYNLKDWPDFKQMMQIQVFSLTPLLYDKNRKPIMSGPRQKSLILDTKLDSRSKKGLIGEDDNVELYGFEKFIVAVWKGNSQIAFISTGLHHHMLLKKCLFSTSDKMFSSPHQIKPDDVDRRYGRHGYKCHMLLHNADMSTLSHLFHCDKESDVSASSAVVFPLDQASSVVQDFSSATSFSWKTDVFKGTIRNLTMLTMTVRDINSDVIWAFSSPVKLNSSSKQEIDFNCSDESSELCYEDDIGRVSMVLRKNSLSDLISIDNAFLEIKYDLLNVWFGTALKLL